MRSPQQGSRPDQTDKSFQSGVLGRKPISLASQFANFSI